MRAATSLLMMLLAAPVAARDILLGPPLACDMAQTCFIQQYVDRDPGPGAADHTCGLLSYDGHSGTDFALPSLIMMEAGVDVIAAAPGTVKAFRDGMQDIIVSSPGAPSVAGKECGNGVLVDHGGGWQTQYCHMMQGSVAVRDGQRVAMGTVLGKVGLSGDTEFPHVHLSVRRDGTELDPFSPEDPVICGASSDKTLWLDPPAYRPGGLIGIGLASAIPEFAAIKQGLAPVSELPASAPALVLWAYAFGGKTGDSVDIAITGPGGEVIRESLPIERTQAQFFRAVGKKRPGDGWPTGPYRATASLIRNGKPLDSATTALTITP